MKLKSSKGVRSIRAWSTFIFSEIRFWQVVFYVGCQLDITVKPDRRHSESSSFSKTAENLSKSEPKEVKNSSIDHEISTIPESQIEEESVAAHKEDGALDHMKTLTKSQSLQKEDLLSVLHGKDSNLNLKDLLFSMVCNFLNSSLFPNLNREDFAFCSSRCLIDQQIPTISGFATVSPVNL